MRYPIGATACALTLALALFACGTGARRMPPASELIAGGHAPAGADAASLERGRTLAATKCAGCHRLYWPQEFPAAAWPAIVADMGRRAGLDQDRIADVTAYFVAAARSSERSGPTARR